MTVFASWFAVLMPEELLPSNILGWIAGALAFVLAVIGALLGIMWNQAKGDRAELLVQLSDLRRYIESGFEKGSSERNELEIRVAVIEEGLRRDREDREDDEPPRGKGSRRR